MLAKFLFNKLKKRRRRRRKKEKKKIKEFSKKIYYSQGNLK